MAGKLLRRWGPLDECGARNLVDAAATLRGLAAVKRGHVLSLAVEIKGGSRGPAAPNRAPTQHFMVRDGGNYAAGLAERHGFGFADDAILLPTHGTTHISRIGMMARSHCCALGVCPNTPPACGSRDSTLTAAQMVHDGATAKVSNFDRPILYAWE